MFFDNLRGDVILADRATCGMRMRKSQARMIVRGIGEHIKILLARLPDPIAGLSRIVSWRLFGSYVYENLQGRIIFDQQTHHFSVVVQTVDWVGQDLFQDTWVHHFA